MQPQVQPLNSVYWATSGQRLHNHRINIDRKHEQRLQEPKITKLSVEPLLRDFQAGLRLVVCDPTAKTADAAFGLGVSGSCDSRFHAASTTGSKLFVNCANVATIKC